MNQNLGKHIIEKGLPYIHIESDYSQEDAGQFATRLEAFLEVVSERKKLK